METSGRQLHGSEIIIDLPQITFVNVNELSTKSNIKMMMMMIIIKC